MFENFNEQFNHAILEYWENFIAALPKIIIGTGLFLILFIIGLIFKRITTLYLMKRTRDKLLVNFIARSILILFLIFGLVVFLNQVGLGAAAGGLLAGAGVSALILGFAFKDIGENFLAGFFLAFSRPFGMGDVIEADNTLGIVRGLNLRNTHVRTYDGKDIFIPNAILIKNKLTNFTRDGLMRHSFIIGVDYNINITDLIKKIVNELNQISMIEKKDELKPFVLIDEFATNAINIQVYYWTDSKNFEGSTILLRSKVMQQILELLVSEGFNLPANIAELKNYRESEPIRIRLEKENS